MARFSLYVHTGGLKSQFISFLQLQSDSLSHPVGSALVGLSKILKSRTHFA